MLWIAEKLGISQALVTAIVAGIVVVAVIASYAVTWSKGVDYGTHAEKLRQAEVIAAKNKELDGLSKRLAEERQAADLERDRAVADAILSVGSIPPPPTTVSETDCALPAGTIAKLNKIGK